MTVREREALFCQELTQALDTLEILQDCAGEIIDQVVALKAGICAAKLQAGYSDVRTLNYREGSAGD